uniref:Uncharacterized protein n=1 Tax=Panagrolaimus davidi TaxID=227884 RepID=A0A914PVI2_9BILA
MVKTPRGRKPGSRHERIVKKLRHRRRMAASRAQHSEDSTSTCYSLTSNSTCSTASSTSVATLPIIVRASEMKHIPITYPRYFTLSEIDQLLSMNEDSDAIVEKVDDSPNAENDDKQMVLWKAGGGGKIVNRGVSEAAAVGAGGKNFDRSILSESDLHPTAIPMPAPPAAVQDVIDIDDDDTTTAHEGHFTDDEEEEEVHPIVAPPPPSHHDEVLHINSPIRSHHDDEERMQHPDEHTDHYLSHLFTPSVANITTDHASHHDSHDEFQRLRNLFSSDSEHTKNVRTIASETSFGLNTLFNNNNTVRNVSSHDTSMGLRTLFEEKSHHNQHHPHHHHHYVPNLPTIHSETTLGLNTLFNNKTVDNVTSSGESSMGLRTLFEENPHVVEVAAADGAGKTVASETSLGLNTLFNNNRTAQNVSSHDTFLGIRSLFEEKSNADIRKISDASNVENKQAVLKKKNNKKMLIKSLLHILHILHHLIEIEENDDEEEVVAPPPVPSSSHPRERLQQHRQVGNDTPSMANIAAALDEHIAQNDKKRLESDS